MRIQLLTMVVLPLVLLATGCVPRAEYDALNAKYADLSGKYEQLKAADEARIAELESQLQELAEARKLAQQRLAMFQDLLEQFGELIESGKLSVKIKDGKMMLEMPGDVLFPSGSAMLSSEGKKVLTEVAKVLANISEREFMVAGHTDTDPITGGPYDDNWELSTQRALGVVRFLEEKGVAPSSLSAAGFSKFQPETGNSSEEGKAQNRRVEIIIMPNLSELPDMSELEKLL
jgi:chemotaxis protein MotB